MTVTIRFEKLRFIGESHDQVRDAQVYRESCDQVPDAPLSDSHDQVRDTQVYRGESRSGLRRSGLSGRVTIRFEMLRFIGESHDQV